MSQVFAAGYNITLVEDLGSGLWKVTGDIIDYSGWYFATDAQVGDAIIDENVFGLCNRWKITELVSNDGTYNLVCKVTWDDEGSADPSGPVACTGAIARPSTLKRIAEVPVAALASISESLKTKLHNIDLRKSIDVGGIDGGISGYLSKYTSETTLRPSGVYESTAVGTSGYIGVGKNGPVEQLDIYKGAVQIEAMDSSPSTPASGFGKMFMTVEGDSPNQVVTWKVKMQDGSEIILGSIIV